MRSGGLENKQNRVATESPTLAGDCIIPQDPHFLYLLLSAAFFSVKLLTLNMAKSPIKNQKYGSKNKRLERCNV
jgi:hypothetical protein